MNHFGGLSGDWIDATSSHDCCKHTDFQPLKPSYWLCSSWPLSTCKIRLFLNKKTSDIYMGVSLKVIKHVCWIQKDINFTIICVRVFNKAVELHIFLIFFFPSNLISQEMLPLIFYFEHWGAKNPMFLSTPDSALDTKHLFQWHICPLVEIESFFLPSFLSLFLIFIIIFFKSVSLT